MDQIDNQEEGKKEAPKKRANYKYGRKKLEENQGSICQFNIRLSKAEKERLKERATKAKLNLTDYCKERIFGEEPLYSINIQDMHIAYKTIADQISPIGNNINQLAKLANISAKHGIVEPDVYKKLNTLLQQFLEQHKKVIDLNLTIIHSKK